MLTVLATHAQTDLWGHIFLTLLVLAVFTGASILLVRYRTRLSGFQRSKKIIKIADRAILAPRKHLYLVDIDTHRLLLGDTENGLSLLKELPRENATHQEDA